MLNEHIYITAYQICSCCPSGRRLFELHDKYKTIKPRLSEMELRDLHHHKQETIQLTQHVTKLSTCGHTNSKTKEPLEYFIISVHTTLTTLSISVRCISSTLWSIILGTLVSMTAELFDKLTPGSSHDGLWVGNRNDL